MLSTPVTNRKFQTVVKWLCSAMLNTRTIAATPPIKSLDIEKQKVSTVDKLSRDTHAFGFMGGTVKVASKDRIISKRLATDVRTVNTSYLVNIEDQSLVLYKDNVRKVLNPNGN